MFVDMGSSNGSRVNGRPVVRVGLKPGDVISLGNTQIRYEITPPFEEADMTVIDTATELDMALDREILPMAIHETGSPRLVVIAGDRTWDVDLDDADVVTIGRTDESDVVVEHSKVSRNHAQLVRQGNLFLLRDLGSTNGTWFQGERVEEMVLQGGEVFRIGNAQLVFKSGFGVEALTMVDQSLADGTGRRPVVFVPGMMGSELWLGNERVWPNVKVMFKDPDLFRYPSKASLEARAIVDQVVVVPNLIKLDQYNRLGDYMVEELGYERGVDFFEFAYDWRQDVRISALQLGKAIDALPETGPIVLIGHSLGTLVSRYYVECLGGARRVERLVLMGGPHSGAVKGLTALLKAPEILPFGLMGERFREIVETFPASYQIIPTYACATDQHGEAVHFLEDERWVAEEFRPLHRAAREFRRELGTRCSVPAISIFGYGIKTVSSVSLSQNGSGGISGISYRSDPSGDGSILERSAVLPGTEIHPVRQYHGTLFVDNDVKMRLKLEVARSGGG
jgi:pSer/pThr/pTyr-binding forkhead associated (FHA) protein